MANWLKAAETKQLRNSIDWHLANVADDRSLRDRLEGMAASSRFRALGWYWAPLLYKRNRATFLPFISQHFGEHFVDDNGNWHAIDWQGEVASGLDPWMMELEQRNEVRLFRRLYQWKHRKPIGWGIDLEVWRKDLTQRFASASPTQRPKVLELYDLHGDLDEPTALTLYRADAKIAAPFILKHLPRTWWGEDAKRQFWREIGSEARRLSQDDFYFALYRKQVRIEDWKRDTLELCTRCTDSERLNVELERRHPEVGSTGLGEHFHKLLETRGRDVLPYVRKHLRNVFSWRGKGGYDAIVALAKRRDWIDLWAATIVTCGDPKQYNAALRETLDGRLDETQRVQRILMLSGVSNEWNYLGWGFARVQQLDEQNALALYERYPEMLRQTFKAHVTPAWANDYFELFERAWEQGDEELADYLASRYITRSYTSKKTRASINDVVADKYVALKLSDEAFARRAANVLTLIPAYSIYNYNHLVRENRLARLLFERSLQSFLDVPAAVRDLVEAAEIHVQQLAYRVLSLDDPRARERARDNLDILIGTLLRPLHRRTRFAAFGALENAASHADCAARVLSKARDAFALPDRHYPKEQLVGLIAKILARHPTLAGPREHTVIYRRAP